MRADRPYVPAEQLEECDRGARRVAEQNRPTVQLSDRPSREQRHALHRPVARDPDLGEEPEQIGVARVLDRADHAHIELSRHQQLVQLGRGPGDELGWDRHGAPVDGPVDREAVDVRDPAEPHSSSATTLERTGSARPRPCPRAAAARRCSILKDGPARPAGPAPPPPGTQASNEPTAWASEWRPTGSFPPPRTRSMILSYESHIGGAPPASWVTRSNTP